MAIKRPRYQSIVKTKDDHEIYIYHDEPISNEDKQIFQEYTEAEIYVVFKELLGYHEIKVENS